MHAISHIIYIYVCVCFVRPFCAYLQAIPPLMYSLPRQGSKVMVLPVKVFTKICMADFRSTRHKRQLEPTTFPVAATLHHDYYTDYTQLKRKLQSWLPLNCTWGVLQNHNSKKGFVLSFLSVWVIVPFLNFSCSSSCALLSFDQQPQL